MNKLIDIMCRYCGKNNDNVRYYAPVDPDNPRFEHLCITHFKCKHCGRRNKIEIGFIAVRGEE